MRHILSALLVLGLCHAPMVYAQENASFAFKDDIRQLKKTARQDYDSGDFLHAVKYFAFLVKYDPNDLELRYYLGMSYMMLDQPEQAIVHLEKAKFGGYVPKEKWSIEWSNELKEYISPQLEWMMARAYHKTNNFSEAYAYYKKFESLAGNHHAYSKEVRDVSRHYMHFAQNGRLLSQIPVDTVELKVLPLVNSAGDEYNPLVGGHQHDILFTQFFKDGSTHLIHAEVSESGHSYLNPLFMKFPDNFYPTAVWRGGNDKSLIICLENGQHRGFYQYVKREKGWVNEGLFEPLNLPAYEINSVHLSLDGNTIVFAGEGPNSIGGSDIYVMRKSRMGRWSIPKNLGEPVNTPFDESSPFVHSGSHQLFFSSQGHTSIGGFDIFSAEFDAETNTWINPNNLGFPVNSAGDDMNYVRTADNKTAYFSSHRHGGQGGLDIYRLDYKSGLRGMALMSGTVVNSKDGSTVQAEVAMSDNRMGANGAALFTQDHDGHFQSLVSTGKTYHLTVRASGYAEKTVSVKMKGEQEYYIESLEIPLDPIVRPGLTKLPNVFFVHNSAQLVRGSYKELDMVAGALLNHPDYFVEIAGHTEPGGTESANLELSQARADMVVQYLHHKGISLKRLKAKGYGSKYPENRGKSEEERQSNRRTEIIIHDIRMEGKKWSDTYSGVLLD